MPHTCDTGRSVSWSKFSPQSANRQWLSQEKVYTHLLYWLRPLLATNRPLKPPTNQQHVAIVCVVTRIGMAIKLCVQRRVQTRHFSLHADMRSRPAVAIGIPFDSWPLLWSCFVRVVFHLFLSKPEFLDGLSPPSLVCTCHLRPFRPSPHPADTPRAEPYCIAIDWLVRAQFWRTIVVNSLDCVRKAAMRLEARRGGRRL